MAENYSINTGVTKKLSLPDYFIFGITLAVSAGIGLCYAIKDRKNVNSKNFLLGDRRMYVFPVAMSLLVTFLSALTLLGTAAEIYNYTTMFWWLCLSFVLAVLTVAKVFVPFFHDLNITSSFEYLEMRFSKAVRVLACLIFIVYTEIYMAFVLYAPSLALHAVTKLDLWGSVVAIGAVVTLYTALGGMKAVLWTDTFQAGVIIAGLLAVLIQGSIKMGGFQNAWDIAANRSRIYFHDFSVDPRTRHSFWSVVIGGTFFWISLYGTNQAQIQRSISCPTVKKAQYAMYINLVGILFVTCLCCMIGIVMYAFYADCHPLLFNNLISKSDQLVPLFVMDILGNLSGIPGLFLSCVFSGSLSSLSSGLNALGAVIPHDLIQPFCCKKIHDRTLTIISKAIIIIFGILSIALAYAVSHLGNVLQAAYSMIAILNGPLCGLFFLGMFFPWANAWGAFFGGIVSLAFMLWVGLGAFVFKVSTPKSPFYTHGCNWSAITTTSTTMMTTSATNLTTTMVTTTTVAPGVETSNPLIGLYALSYLYYTPTAIAVIVVVGMLVSLVTGRRDPKTLDPRLTCPVFDRLFPCLPECILKPLRCGVRYKQEEPLYEEKKSSHKETGIDNMAREIEVEKSNLRDSSERNGTMMNRRTLNDDTYFTRL